MRYVIVVAPTDFFKTLTTRRCFFFSTLFLVVLALSASGIAVSGATEDAGITEAEAKLSLTNFQSLKQTFLGAAYSFSFSIQRRNIRFTGSLDGFLVDDD